LLDEAIGIPLEVEDTEVDHGTAFDIEWQGKASHENMMAAFDYAYLLVTGSGSASRQSNAG